MTYVEKAERHKRIAAAYQAGAVPRELTCFGLSPRRIREIARLYGVSRPRGRPSSSPTRATGVT